MKKTNAAVAVIEAPAKPQSAVAILRRRLANATQHEQVLLDFLEDDLREARDALAEVAHHLDATDALLLDPGATRGELVEKALDGAPLERLDYLSAVLGNLRKRLVQVAARL